MKLKVKKLHKDAILPTKNYDTDACFDLYSNERIILKSAQTTLVSTGIAMEIPEGYAGFIWDRSGLSSKGVHRLAGVVDFGYVGEIKVVLINLNETQNNYLYGSLPRTHIIEQGDRIAQIFITKVEPIEITEVDVLATTDRGDKGFGSSGK